MRYRHLLIAPLLLLAACAGDKYPYPPQYVDSHDVPATVLMAPPAKGSATYNSEVAEIIALQARLTPAQIAAIQHEDHIAPDKILYPVLGARYSAVNYPVLYDFLNRAASDSWRIGDDARNYWKSPRPWYAEPAVKSYVEPLRAYGYPSGHTTTFGTWAYILADLFPKKADAFFKQAWSVGNHRIGGGAHYPHDIAGGKTMALAVFDAMRERPSYQQDFARAKAEIAAGGSAHFTAKPFANCSAISC